MFAKYAATALLFVLLVFSGFTTNTGSAVTGGTVHSGPPPPQGQGAIHEAAAAASSTAPVINATTSSIISSPATYGTELVFSQIGGLPAGLTVVNNSTGITDSTGRFISCTNQAYTVSQSGDIIGLVVKLLGNASTGPFSLNGIVGGQEFQVSCAGISSKPSGNTVGIYAVPNEQSTGGIVTVLGADFASGQDVGYPVVGNQSYQSAHDVIADSNGAFTVTFTLRTMPAGNYTVRMSNAIQKTAEITVVPSLVLIPSEGQVGQNVVAQLTGFAPGGIIRLSWDNNVLKSAMANGQGMAELVLQVPGSTRGVHILEASSSGFSTAAVFTVNSSSIVLSRYGASPGTNIGVYAEGFSAGDIVHLVYNGRAIRQTAQAGSNGTAVLQFTVPPMTAGSYPLEAVSAGGVASNTTQMIVRPVISASSAQVYVGSVIGISGAFFYPSTVIKLFMGSNLIPQTFTSGQNGTLYANVTVPSLPGGIIALGAYDLEGNNATAFSMNILPNIQLSSESGSTGSDLMIHGTGFIPGRQVAILWNGVPVLNVTSVTSNGSFLAMLKIPRGKPGSYLVTVGNSTAPGVIFDLRQYTGFDQLLPAILLPLVTAVGAAIYLFGRFRVSRMRK